MISENVITFVFVLTVSFMKELTFSDIEIMVREDESRV